MLKKILSIILLTLLFINYSFAYNPTYKDKQIVNKINYKIGKIHKINFEKINILESNIKKLVVKYSYNTRIKYVLNKVLEYIDSLKNPNDFTLIEEIFNTDNSENDSDENNSNINDSQSSENTCVNDTNRFDKTATFLRDVYVTPNTLKDAIRNVKP